MKSRTVSRLLWVSFIVRGAYFLGILLMMLAQSPIKTLFSSSDSAAALFTVPYAELISGLIGLLVHLIVVLLVCRSLNSGGRHIPVEIIGIVCFSGVFGFLYFYISTLVTRLVAMYGVDRLASASVLQRAIAFLSPVAQISGALLLLGLAFSIAIKKAKPSEYAQ